ncbi:MAG TPA: acetyl-CoA carboxylase biotin carboxyl carrier protein subunit [Bdellovibrionales bacterium]|jgi:biotin carboxyl carrier protein|nr:acetyl-CoA carboxylase biotin carboxyl carrier protein subunit [Bdellovibrionales bacterium]
MFFEADLRGKHYKIDITESKRHWKISLQEDAKDWVRYEVSKDDYKLVENTISLIFKGNSYILDCVGSGTEYNVYTRAAYANVTIYNDEAILHESLKKGGAFGAGDKLTAGMPGKIVKVLVNKGDVVKANQPILIMEAMKMENEMRAPQDTQIKDVLVKAGDSVESGQTLISFETKK